MGTTIGWGYESYQFWYVAAAAAQVGATADNAGLRPRVAVVAANPIHCSCCCLVCLTAAAAAAVSPWDSTLLMRLHGSGLQLVTLAAGPALLSLFLSSMQPLLLMMTMLLLDASMPCNCSTAAQISHTAVTASADALAATSTSLAEGSVPHSIVNLSIRCRTSLSDDRTILIHGSGGRVL